MSVAMSHGRNTDVTSRQPGGDPVHIPRQEAPMRRTPPAYPIRRARPPGSCSPRPRCSAVSTPAHAASLTQVTGFGSTPATSPCTPTARTACPPAPRPVVLLHGCTQNATGYFANSGWRSTPTSGSSPFVRRAVARPTSRSSCFNWFETATSPGARARRCRSSRWSTTRSPATASTRPGSTSAGCPPAAR